jgi:gamma-glutamyltranspeptidase/glutathione hydrolase
MKVTIAAMVMCVVGVLSAESPCHDDRLPPELCATEARSDFGMVATGSPEATEAAVEILERGGNAIDAAVAAALTLGVADSDASGIGGMTYLVIHLADGRTFAVDGSSRTPLTIDIERYRKFKQRGRNFGYELIAVPTTLATLEYARKRYGTLDMATLLQPAIEVAEKGYKLSRLQIIWTEKYHENIMKSSVYMQHLAMEDGRTIGNPGDHICEPDLANTYRRIAVEGVWSFYAGSIADEIEDDMIRGGSFLRKSDLARVRIREVQPLHTTYRGYDVYTFPPPGGGAHVVFILNLVETYPSDFVAQFSVERNHVFIETCRIAAVDAPLTAFHQSSFGLDPLTKNHARDRAALIVQGKAIPTDLLESPLDPECETGGDSTTQVSIADNLGNAVSLTQTLSRSFGAKAATPGLGFSYNNFLEFFNADKPQCPGYLQANSPCTSLMAPTIVLKHGTFFAALGAPGSSKIPPLVADVISRMVDRGMGVRDAVVAPRVLWGAGDNHPVAYLELVDPITEENVDLLEQMGFEGMIVLRYPPPNPIALADFGGVNAVAYDSQTGVFTGVGDPRRYGSAMGPRVVPVRD